MPTRPIFPAIALIVAVFFVSCFSIDEDPVKTDATPPTAGGAVVFDLATLDTITLHWPAAVDDVSPGGLLQYQVMMSTQDNIGSLEAALNNGKFARVWSTNTCELTVTGLTSARWYYFTVLVKDQADNKAAYPMAARKTATVSDTVFPVAGDGGALAIDLVGPYAFRLTWTKGSDPGGSDQTNLMYLVVRSGSGDIDTVANATNNGTPVKNWTRDLGSVVVDGLAANTAYWVNVLVRDEYGNVTAYTMASQVTTMETVATPVISPVQGSYDDVQTVSFSCATPGASMRYTEDGVTTPASTVGTPYGSGFTCNRTRTYKVLAYKAGYLDSAVATSTVTIHNGILEVTGAGTAAYNETYYLAAGRINNKRYWANAGGYHFCSFYEGGPGWVIASGFLQPAGSASAVYYQYNSGDYPAPTGWYTAGGSMPVPSVNLHD